MPDVTLTTPPQFTREQLANLRTLECSAMLEPVETLDTLKPAEKVALAAVEEAAGPPLITNGKPTVARVVAWMVHEGVNRNRQGFVKEELPAAAAKIGLPDGPLVMDFNHSAIRKPDGEQRMVGVWYKADYAFDQKANEGKGAWGLLVQGVMFAWLFPDIANGLLAEQARKGAVDFSMACIAGSVEQGRDDKGPYEILHNPAFFTNSLLDVPPADKDAHGMLAEGSDDPALEQKMIEKLCSAEALQTRVQELVAAALKDTEGRMAEETKPTLEVSQSEPDQNGEVTVTATMTLADGTVTVKKVNITVRKQMTVNGASEELTAKVADLETALEAAKASGEQLTTQVAELTTQNESLTARVAQVDAAEAAQAAKAKLTARVAELPEAYRTKHVAKAEAERAELETRWAAKSDEDWKEFVALLADAVPTAPSLNTASYRARTINEGTLVVPSGSATGNSISERVHKVLNS